MTRLPPPSLIELSGVTRSYGTGDVAVLLVFDEVMTGFRVALGGAQSLYAKLIPGFAPDISVFGKVIGGGMPLAAFGGRRAVMEQLAPLGPVYQAGTLSGNPLAVSAGLAMLRNIRKDAGLYARLEERAAALCAGAGPILALGAAAHQRPVRALPARPGHHRRAARLPRSRPGRSRAPSGCRRRRRPSRRRWTSPNASC